MRFLYTHVTVFMFALMVFPGILQASTAQKPEIGLVVRVLDGDTLAVLYAPKQVRTIDIYGIDAPERQQAYGEVATAALTMKSLNAWVEFVCHKTNEYGRDSCEVRRRDTGLDLGMSMVKHGHAWASQVPNVPGLVEETMQAAMHRLGLFSFGTIGLEPPWVFKDRVIRTLVARRQKQRQQSLIATRSTLHSNQARK